MLGPMRTIVAALLLGLAACGFTVPAAPDASGPRDDGAPDDDGQPGAWLDGFAFRMPLTITTGGDTTLDEFVVAIIVPADPALALHVANGGRDLAFTAGDAVTPLAFELERFDGTTGALVAWVRFPSLAPSTSAYVYYGAGDLDLQDPAATWSPTTFEGVWHLTDPDAGTARDSTTGARALAAPTAGQRPVLAATAIAGDGRGFDGNDDKLEVADDGHFDHGTDAFSYGVWVKVTQNVGAYDMPLFKGGQDDNTPGYDLELGTGTWRAWAGDGQAAVHLSFGDEAALRGDWVHLVAVIDRPAQLLRAYTNGVEAATESIANLGSTDSTFPLSLGDNTGGSYPFRGELDEVRIYARALSPAWIAAEFANLSAPSSFVVRGAEQARP